MVRIPKNATMEANEYLGSFFNASLQELARAGERLENLAELTDGGFLASIGVYHELHCLVCNPQLLLRVYTQLTLCSVKCASMYTRICTILGLIRQKTRTFKIILVRIPLPIKSGHSLIP
jgi:hypothetical protein